MSVQIKNLDMASEVQVYNNFLSKTDFNELKEIFLNTNNFPYYLQNYKVVEGDGFTQFTHIFYQDQNVSSDFYGSGDFHALPLPYAFILSKSLQDSLRTN